VPREITENPTTLTAEVITANAGGRYGRAVPNALKTVVRIIEFAA
jgi:hypothetical protein